MEKKGKCQNGIIKWSINRSRFSAIRYPDKPDNGSQMHRPGLMPGRAGAKGGALWVIFNFTVAKP